MIDQQVGIYSLPVRDKSHFFSSNENVFDLKFTYCVGDIVKGMTAIVIQVENLGQYQKLPSNWQ